MPDLPGGNSRARRRMRQRRHQRHPSPPRVPLPDSRPGPGTAPCGRTLNGRPEATRPAPTGRGNSLVDSEDFQ